MYGFISLNNNLHKKYQKIYIYMSEWTVLLMYNYCTIDVSNGGEVLYCYFCCDFILYRKFICGEKRRVSGTSRAKPSS